MVKVREQLLHAEDRKGNTKEGHFLLGGFAKQKYVILTLIIKNKNKHGEQLTEGGEVKTSSA